MKRLSEGQCFSNPGNDTAVMMAWERFLNGERGLPDALRGLVDRSWRRCQEANVDPDRRQAPPPLPEQNLYELRRNHGELLEASAPVMACARDFLAETGTVMLLADTRCTILTLEGDVPTIDQANSIHLAPGVAWSERICGTNAIGTALAVGQPVQIHSAEHYCAGIKRWTCSATVVRHPHDGEIIGVVDVSGLSETYNRQSLALAVTTASRIENRLAMREMELRCQLLDNSMERWVSGTSDGLVLFDRRGQVIKINEQAEAAVLVRGGDSQVITRAGRIPALTLFDSKPIGPLPLWMETDWLVPVLSNGQRLGSLLVMPCSRPQRSSNNRTAAPGLESPVPAAAGQSRFSAIITRNTELKAEVCKARRLAKSQVPILLLGETGVGKEEFAKGIHESSRGAGGAYVALNCGGLSRELLASELFGYAEGAFTGARKGGMTGKIEAANNGTLFLDEVGEMPLDLQPHLLRVLEEGELYRLGENTPRKVNFRLVAATHRNLRDEVAAGRFRMDLYYRVAVTTIRLTALRSRKEDVLPLVEHFLARFSELHGGGTNRRLGAGVRERLLDYDWPGNVRELRNVVESMVLMSDESEIGMDGLPTELFEIQEHDGNLPIPPGQNTKVLSIADSEAVLIRRAIDAAGGNLTQAARDLKIAKSTLYLKLRRYGLTVDRRRIVAG